MVQDKSNDPSFAKGLGDVSLGDHREHPESPRTPDPTPLAPENVADYANPDA